jgi:ribosomal protein S18 acetylase RimI-like enzyme
VSRGQVAIEPARNVAAEALEPWFAAAWAAMWGPAEPLEIVTAADWVRPEADRERWVATVDGEPVGIADCRNDDETMTMTVLAVAPGQRNMGVGAEVVELLERRSQARRACALFPLANGYAFYFWLRSGYRPQFAYHEGQQLNRVVRDLR